MNIRKTMVAAALLLVGFATTACEDKAAAPTPAAPAATDAKSSDTKAADSGSSDSGAALPQAAPKDFPVPKGAKIDAAADGSFVVIGDDAKKVVAFYRAELPGAGYKITSDVEAAGVVSLDFEGKGIKGNIALAGNAVAVSIIK